MGTKKVKIIKALKDTFWYADKIGKVFEVEDYFCNNSEYLIIIDGNGYFIDKDDCIEVIDYVSDSTTAIDPKHYQLPIEPKDFIIKNELGFCEGNVIKYICRYKQKNGIEDLKKAKQYIDFLINEIETKSNR